MRAFQVRRSNVETLEILDWLNGQRIYFEIWSVLLPTQRWYLEFEPLRNVQGKTYELAYEIRFWNEDHAAMWKLAFGQAGDLARIWKCS